MRVAIRDHQANGRPFGMALARAGHELTAEQPDAVLIDYDLEHPAYRPFVDLGGKVIVYPHGWGAAMAWDLIGEPIDEVACQLVIGEGQAELLRAYDYPKPVHVIGWPWGPVCEAEPRECRRVLFAPHHPYGSGFLHRAHKQANAEAYRLLLSEPYELTVRYIGSLEAMGLWAEPGVQYVRGQMDGSTTGIEDADVVVAFQTFAGLAFTKGVPLVMLNQAGEWQSWKEGTEVVAYPDGWRRWQDFARYPYDLEPGACEKAAAAPNTPEVCEWRDRFIGKPMDPAKLVATVEQVVRGELS